jgi:hypothetical protein
MSKVVQVANMMANKPDTNVDDVAKKLKISKPYAYTLMSQARKRFINRRDEALAKPKIRMQSSERKENWETVSVTTGEEPLFGRRGEHLETTEPKPDNVNHPAHYKVGGIETIDFIEAKGLNYHLGNVVKYVTRADHKGDRLENLEKARWYLDREISKLK